MLNNGDPKRRADELSSPYKSNRQNYSYGYPSVEQENIIERRGHDINSYNNPSFLDKYDIKKSSINMAIYSILCGLIIFAVSFAVDSLVAELSKNAVNSPVENIGSTSAILTLIIFFLGMAYIFIEPTGNETMYKVAILALSVVALMISSNVFILDPWQLSVPVTLAVLFAVAAINAGNRLVKNNLKERA